MGAEVMQKCGRGEREACCSGRRSQPPLAVAAASLSSSARSFSGGR